MREGGRQGGRDGDRGEGDREGEKDRWTGGGGGGGGLEHSEEPDKLTLNTAGPLYLGSGSLRGFRHACSSRTVARGAVGSCRLAGRPASRCCFRLLAPGAG